MHELSRGERNSGPSRALHEPVNRLCVILPVIDHFVCPASRARQDLLSRNFLVNFELEPPRGAYGRYIQVTDSPSRPLPALPGGDCEVLSLLRSRSVTAAASRKGIAIRAGLNRSSTRRRRGRGRRGTRLPGGGPRPRPGASQYAAMAPLFEHYGVQLWMPETGGRVDYASEHDEKTMTMLGLSSKREIIRTSIRVRTALAVQTREQAGISAVVRRTGTGWPMRGRTRTRPMPRGGGGRTGWNLTR